MQDDNAGPREGQGQASGLPPVAARGLGDMSVTERAAIAVAVAIEAAAAARTLDPRGVIAWRFDEAPEELRDLSRHGGDEDWLAVLPPGQTMPAWMAPGSAFGCCDVSEHDLIDGSTVCIGAHS